MSTDRVTLYEAKLDAVLPATQAKLDAVYGILRDALARLEALGRKGR